MFKLKSLIDVKDFNEIVNLLNHFINRDDLKFYRVIIETNDSGTFTVYRDLEFIYIEQEKFIERCKVINTGKFQNLKDVLAFIKIFEKDIILEIEIEITVDQFENINNVLNEVRQFNPTILQITKEIVIYEEFKN
ncbi:MAG: hypothetical protein QXW35_05210 [Candidatus Aenigmatarchaeota archaeon]